MLGFLLAAIGPACGGEPDTPTGPEVACIADSLGELRGLSGDLPSCAPADPSCRNACMTGDARSCLANAYAAETSPATTGEAVLLFHRACSLGLANACTNYAAGIWAGNPTKAQWSCAGRIFQKACNADEPFACGMRGRMLFEQASSPEDRERAGQELDASCKRVGGFPCRVLAKHLEAGDLGSYDRGRVGALLERACEGGDADACGHPATAAETFH